MKIEVLDHGYVEHIESWGTGRGGRYEWEHDGETHERVHDRDCEVGIIEAARQSTQGSFRGWDQDQKLLAFLYNNVPPHAGPFEFSGMTIEVQAPIFVFREWHRHRTQSYNEMSARYAPLPDLYYLPTVDRMMAGVINKTSNKQEQAVSGAPVLSQTLAENTVEIIQNMYEAIENSYQLFLRSGVPKEVARVVMPVGHYSRMRASANLRNWLAFLTLRMDPNAQWEIRQFANAVGSIIEKQFPRTWELFNARR